MGNIFDNRDILVVDDDDDTRCLIAEILESLNPSIRFREASNGREALAAVTERQPDLVILDLNMPIMDGYKVLERLRASEETRHVPVLVLTGQDHKFIEIGALDGGADDFLGKPIAQVRLVARMQSLLRSGDRYRHTLKELILAREKVHALEEELTHRLVEYRQPAAQPSPPPVAPPLKPGDAGKPPPPAPADPAEARLAASRKLIKARSGMDPSDEAAQVFATSLDALSRQVLARAAMVARESGRERIELADLELVFASVAAWLSQEPSLEVVLQATRQLKAIERSILLKELMTRTRSAE